MIEIKQITDEYYPIICKWWEEYHKVPFMSKELLPNQGLGGLILFKDNHPICSGYVYLTNSKIAWVEYVIADKSYRAGDRNDLIKDLIKQLEYYAKINGADVCFTITASKTLIEKYKENGWLGDEEPSFELIKRIELWE